MSSGPNWPGQGEVKIPEVNLSKLPFRWILLGLLVIVLLFLGWNSFYQVDPEQQAMILRFGSYTGKLYEPGLHFKYPIIDQEIKVPTRRQLKQEFGFRTAQPGVRTEYSDRDFPEESLMLTGDLNVADVEWVVQYRIAEPFKFVFKVRDVRSTFRDLNEAVMREIVGDHSVDEVLTFGRREVAMKAKDLLQDLADRYETGIRVEQLVLQDVNPPGRVKPSFNEVNQAIQQREEMINNARAEYNRAVPRAEGEAEQMIRQAEGYKLERVNNAEGEADRFTSVYEEYRKAPSVTRRRMYVETMQSLMPKLGEKVIVDENLENLVPLMNMGLPMPQSGGGSAGNRSGSKGGAQ
jgi:membrane protease subunit HflK